MLARNYRNGEYGEPDPETAAYYLRWGEKIGKRHPERLKMCQHFCEDLAKAKMPGGILTEDLFEAYRLLEIAAESYTDQIENNGYHYLQEDLERVEKLLDSAVFDELRGRKREASSEDEEAERIEDLLADDEDDDDDAFLGTADSSLLRGQKDETPPDGGPSA